MKSKMETAPGSDEGAYRSALESSVTPVILIDEDFMIIFANRATMNMMREHREVFTKAYPGFDPDSLIGTCIDRFHRNPSHQRRMMRNPAIFPHRAEISVGDLHFELNVSRTTDASGRATGFALQWSDISPRVRYGDEVSRVMSALRAGDLTVRGDVEAMSSEYRPMLQSLNEVIEVMGAPILSTMGAIRRVARGQSAEPITARYEGTFAELCDRVNDLIASTDRITTIASQIADGDLTMKVQKRSEEDVLMGALGRMMVDLNTLLRQVQGSSHQLDQGSAQVQEASQSLANNASRSAASLEEISASMEEIS
ncbi:MAG TPA: methyl-accepting chemotaxis protein, partial [Deltaproteobacteria bacterium]|nr:methyl-accepting chemotaxis protein [Deltaproteobacteria bacterium]